MDAQGRVHDNVVQHSAHVQWTIQRSGARYHTERASAGIVFARFVADDCPRVAGDVDAVHVSSVASRE